MTVLKDAPPQQQSWDAKIAQDEAGVMEVFYPEKAGMLKKRSSGYIEVDWPRTVLRPQLSTGSAAESRGPSMCYLLRPHVLLAVTRCYGIPRLPTDSLTAVAASRCGTIDIV